MAKVLDDESLNDVSSYIGLAELLEVSKENITLLRLCQAGGGNPALCFLDDLCLRYPSTPVSELVEKVENDEDMPDGLVPMLFEYEEKSIQDIPRPVLVSLSVFLASSETGKLIVSGWRSLADAFGYDVSKMDQISVTIKRNAVYSPTEQLFKLLRCEQPGLQLRKVSEKLEKLRNIGAKDILDQFMEDTSRKRSRKKK